MWTMLKKLGAGEYSLKITFWLFGLMGMLFFTIATHITHSGALRLVCYGRVCPRSILLYILSNIPNLMTGSSGRLSAFVPHLLVCSLFICYFIILMRGLWKCGNTYEGAKFWTVCAKTVIICLGFLSLKSII